MSIARTPRTHRPGLAVRALIVTALALFLLAGPAARPAAAHVSLVASSPGYNEVLETAPAELTLTFGDNVESALVRTTLTDANDTEISEPENLNDAGATTEIRFALPDLDAGEYKVRWTVYAYDGHTMEGIIPFTIGQAVTDEPSASDEDPDGGVEEPTATTVPGDTAPTQDPGGDATVDSGTTAAGSRLVSVLGMQARFLLYMGLTVGVGALFWLAVPIASADHRRLVRTHARSLLRAAVAAIAVVGALRAVIAAFSALSSIPFQRRIAVAVLSSAPVWAWLLVTVLAVATIAAQRGSQAHEDDVVDDDGEAGSEGPLGAPWWAAAALFGAAMFLSSSVSHAISGPIPVASMIFGSVHVAAAALWFGPLVVWVLLRYRPYWLAENVVDRSKALVAPLRTYGTIAWWSAVAVTISGVRSAMAYSDGSLPSGSYGTILAVKLAVVLAVIVPAGIYHFTRVTRRGATRPARFIGTVFERSSLVEVAGFVIVLALAAVLSATSPV